MKSNRLSQTQTICLVVLFLFGNSAVFGVNTTSGRDTWIAIILAILLAVPVFLVYSRVLSKYPGQDLYDLLYTAFGKKVGTVFILLFTWYAIHLAALLLRTLVEFISTNALPNPPYFLFLATFLLVSIYLLKKGVETIGKWSTIVCTIVGLLLISTFLFSLKAMNFSAILPILRRSPFDILDSTMQLMAFPILECVIIIPLLSQVTIKKPRKALLTGLLISGFILLLIFLTNLLLLGEPMLERLFFPSYTSSKLLNVGRFLTRIEEGIAMYILLTSLTKLSVCIYVASKGLSKIVNEKKPDAFFAPVGILSLALAAFVAESMMDLTNFITVYPVYAFFFQIIIPLIILIGIELKSKKIASATS